MSYLMDIDVAMAAHVQRTRTTEARNRTVRRGTTRRRSGERRNWHGIGLSIR